MTELRHLIRRNCKMFFKDKGMFFTSLITPIILLVLYVTFLATVYKNSFSQIVEGMPVEASEKLINAVAGGQMFSSLLAVSCVTVSFCSNMLMVTDKVTGVRNDLLISPTKASTLAFSYYIGSALSTLAVSFIAFGGSMIYMACVGWYMSAGDVFLIVLDIIMLVLFGTALSSLINHFLTSQGQISAVGAIVSSGYGFICGAYMPISILNDGLRTVLLFLPGTYGTSLIKNHAMSGTFAEMERLGWPSGAIEEVKKSVDCNLYFFDNKVELWVMYLVMGLSIALILTAYILVNVIKIKKHKKD